MRVLIALAALALAGCDASVRDDAGGASAGRQGYTLEVRADASQHTYLIATPDGRTIGARAAEGASALMDSARAQALLGDPPTRSSEDLPPEVMSLRLPGFEMSVRGEEDAAGDGENGQVQLSIGGGEQRVIVDADEGGPGEADDRAYVRITGADEAAVRDFINDAEELSPQVKAAMLAELGLQ